MSGEGLLHQLLELGAASVVLREEEDADRETALAWKRQVLAVRDFAQELSG